MECTKTAHRQHILGCGIKDGRFWHAGVTVLLDSIWRQYREGIVLPRVVQQCLEALSNIMVPHYPDQVVHVLTDATSRHVERQSTCSAELGHNGHIPAASIRSSGPCIKLHCGTDAISCLLHPTGLGCLET